MFRRNPLMLLRGATRLTKGIPTETCVALFESKGAESHLLPEIPSKRQANLNSSPATPTPKGYKRKWSDVWTAPRSYGFCTIPTKDSSENYAEWARNTLKRARQDPSADLVSDLFYALLKNEDLAKATKHTSFLLEVSGLAASVAHTMNPAQVLLIFRTFSKLMSLHAGLLDTVAESVMGSGDFGCFSTDDLCFMLSALAKLRRGESRTKVVNQGFVLFPSEERFLKSVVSELVEARMERMTGDELSRILYVLASLGFDDAEVLEKLTRQIEGRRYIHAFSEKELSNMIYAYAAMGSSDRFVVEILANELTQVKRRPNLLPGDVAMAIYSLGRLGYGHLKQVINHLAGVLVQPNFITNARNEELASIVYGFGKLGYKNRGVLELLLREILKPKRLDKLGGCEIVSILHGMASVSYQNETGVGALSKAFANSLETRQTKELCGVVYAWGQLLYQDGDLLKRILLELMKLERRPTIKTGEVAIVIHALGLLGFQGQRTIAEIVEVWVAPDMLEKYNENGLSMLVFGLALCRFNDRRVLQMLLDEVVRPERLWKMPIAGISNCVYGLGYAGIKDKRIMGLLAMEAVKPKRAGSMEERHLANMIYSLGKLGFKHVCMGILMQMAVEPNRLKSFTDQGLSNILYGLARVGFDRHDLIKMFSRELIQKERLKNMSERHLTLAVYSLGKLRIKDRSVVDVLLSSVIRRGHIEKIASGGLLQVFMGLSNLSYDNIHVIRVLVEEITRRQKMAKLKSHQVLQVMRALGMLAVDENSGVEGLVKEIVESVSVGDLSGKDLAKMVERLKEMKMSKGIELSKKFIDEMKRRMERGKVGWSGVCL